jgi:hypothetical protein
VSVPINLPDFPCENLGRSGFSAAGQLTVTYSPASVIATPTSSGRLRLDPPLNIGMSATVTFNGSAVHDSVNVEVSSASGSCPGDPARTFFAAGAPTLAVTFTARPGCSLSEVGTFSGRFGVGVQLNVQVNRGFGDLASDGFRVSLSSTYIAAEEDKISLLSTEPNPASGLPSGRTSFQGRVQYTLGSKEIGSLALELSDKSGQVARSGVVDVRRGANVIQELMIPDFEVKNDTRAL